MRYYYSLMKYHISAYNHHRIRNKINYTQTALLNNRRKLRVIQKNQSHKNYKQLLMNKIKNTMQYL